MSALNLKDKKVLVFDYGIFVCVAHKLSEVFGQVDYYNPWKSDFPRSSETEIGQGFKEINKIQQLEMYLLKTPPDLVVFTDIYDGWLQILIEEKFKIPVWGCREAEAMEIYRWDFLQYQKKIDMDVPESYLVVGIDELRKKITDDSWVIKIDANERGDAETYVTKHPDLTEIKFNRWQADLGFKGKEKKFIIQKKIKGIREIGYDGFTIDGEFPSVTLFGREVKGSSYFGEVRKYEDLPEGIKVVNSQLSSTLKSYGMKGTMSTEIIDTKNEHFLIDPCMRFPSPPTEVMIEIWGNMGECMYQGARGIMTTPEYEAKFAAEIICQSESAVNDYYTLIYPDSIKRWVKQRKITFMEGRRRVIPQKYGNTNVGSVIAIGDNKDQVIKEVKARAGMVIGDNLKIEIDSIDLAVKEMSEV